MRLDVSTIDPIALPFEFIAIILIVSWPQEIFCGFNYSYNDTNPIYQICSILY